MTTDRYPYNIAFHLAGIPVCLHTQYEGAKIYFGPYAEAFPVGAGSLATHVRVTEDDWEQLARHGFQRCGQAEASYLTAHCSDVLLENHRCIVHAAAFRDERYAWLIAAAPGVGKSTQLATLDRLYPGRYSVICGDRPVVEVRGDDRIIVHPSPWNGKEGWGGAEAAPLGGIILLRRGEQNSVKPVTKKSAALPVFQSIIQTALTEDGIRNAAACADAILSRVPVWEFVNEDVPKSTELLYETVLRDDAQGAGPVMHG